MSWYPLVAKDGVVKINRNNTKVAVKNVRLISLLLLVLMVYLPGFKTLINQKPLECGYHLLLIAFPLGTLDYFL
jgi:hypothetical protein